MAELYIGLMSGTSADGIDAALVDFSAQKVLLAEFLYLPYPVELRQQIHLLSQAPSAITLKDYGTLDSRLGSLFAKAALALLDKAGVSANTIRAIGSHGQTVYHAPEMPNGFSLQIGDPNCIVQQTGITTIADFRRRDIAAGGQGAPLVPAFHQALFSTPRQVRCVVNIGGIANLTLLDQTQVIGFDTGPGNALMDYWCEKHCGLAYDSNGDWAAGGEVIAPLLKALKEDRYFQLPPPKSTGKEYFSEAWLTKTLASFPAYPAVDIQATLSAFTADTIADAINTHASQSELNLVCGGGAHNRTLLKQLQLRLKQPVTSTSAFGVDPDHVEAMAFAWLARQTLSGLPGNLCSVTGANKPVILGAIYPADSRLDYNLKN